jgi:hypothetical protein
MPSQEEMAAAQQCGVEGIARMEATMGIQGQTAPNNATLFGATFGDAPHVQGQAASQPASVEAPTQPAASRAAAQPAQPTITPIAMPGLTVTNNPAIHSRVRNEGSGTGLPTAHVTTDFTGCTAMPALGRGRGRGAGG